MQRFGVLPLLLLSAMAVAQTGEPADTQPAETGGPAQRLVFASEPERIAEILRSEGLAARLGTDSYGDPKIESASQGATWVLYFFECRDNANCRSVQFFSGFDVEPGLPPEQVAAWNRENRYAKVTVDEEGDPRFQMDVNLDRGVTEANFRDTIYLWNQVLAAFLAHIGW